MGYIKPIKSKGKRGKKHLTIYNTDHYKNYASTTEAEMDNVVALTGKNLSAYYEELLKHAKLGISQDKRNFLYVLSGEAYANEDMLAKFIDLGVHIQVLTMGLLSDTILDALAGNKHTSAVYILRSNPAEIVIDNVMKAHEATKVIMDCPVILPDISGYKVIEALSNYRVAIDELQLDFPVLNDKELGVDTRGNVLGSINRKPFYYSDLSGKWHVYTEKKYSFYKSIEPSCSSWGIYIKVICEDYSSKQELDKMAQK